MGLEEIKKAADSDRVNGSGEIGFAEGVVDGRLVLVTARKCGANKPGRREHVRFAITDKGAA